MMCSYIRALCLGGGVFKPRCFHFTFVKSVNFITVIKRLTSVALIILQLVKMCEEYKNHLNYFHSEITGEQNFSVAVSGGVHDVLEFSLFNMWPCFFFF